MPMLFIILAFVGWCYFCNKYNRKELINKRNDLLDNLSKDCCSRDSGYFVRKLRAIDFKLFGGCKSKNSYARCYLCDISRCPRHGSNDAYYEMLDRNRIEYPDIPID